MSKKNEVIDKWSEKIRQSVINIFVEGDKTPTTKYLSYMCNIWYNTRNVDVKDKPKNSSEVVKYVKQFDELLPYLKNKDIYSSTYNSWSELVNKVDQAQELKQEKEFIKEDHVDVIIENDEYIFLRPKTYRGSLKYGANTRWCTSSKIDPNTFSAYNRNGILLYLIRKKTKNNKWDKLAFYQQMTGSGPMFNAVQIYCSEDTSHNSNSIVKSDWSLIELLVLQNIVRSMAVKQWRTSQSAKNVKDLIKKLHQIDVENTIVEMKILHDKTDYNYTQLIDHFKDSVMKFTEKTSLLE
jgi:hypothetical protein